MPIAGDTGFQTYDLTVGVKLDYEDAIYLLSPFDVPLLGSVDSGGRSALASGNVTEKKYEWQDEELLLPKTTVNGAQTNVETSLEVAAGTGIRFGVGDLLRIGAEVLRVEAVATDTLTVERGYAGTSGAAISDGDAVVCIGQALPEGSDPGDARALDRVNRFNYTQIFGPHKIHVTGSENAVAKYGLQGTEFDHQTANRFKEMMISLEQAVLYGERQEDTTNKLRSFGGLFFWITTNVNSTDTAITEALLLDQLQTCYDAGGNPDRIVVGSKRKREISAFNSTLIRYDKEDTARGQVVENYDSDFGRQAVILDRWVRRSDAFIFNRDQAEVVTLRPATFEMLAKTGDAVSGMIVAEKGFKFRRELHAARFSALT